MAANPLCQLIQVIKRNLNRGDIFLLLAEISFYLHFERLGYELLFVVVFLNQTNFPWPPNSSHELIDSQHVGNFHSITFYFKKVIIDLHYFPR